jgi:CIC family chloride channel protein
MRALVGRVRASAREVERGAEAAEFAVEEPHEQVHVPSTPLDGYEIVEVTIGAQTPASGRLLGDVAWPAGSSVVAVTEGDRLVAPRADIELRPGGRVVLLAPAAAAAARLTCRAESG